MSFVTQYKHGRIIELQEIRLSIYNVAGHIKGHIYRHNFFLLVKIGKT